MTKRKYPRTEYLLTDAGHVRPVTLVFQTWSSYPEWDSTDDNRRYRVSKLHPTRKAAIAAGRAEVEKAEARLIVTRKNLDKKIANLKKAESEK